MTDHDRGHDNAPVPELMNWQQFRAGLITACAQERPMFASVDRLPKRIDLGPIAAKALECAEETKQDPEKRERGGHVLWERASNRLLLPQRDKLVVGTKSDVPLYRFGSQDDSTRQHPELLELQRQFTAGFMPELVYEQRVRKLLGQIRGVEHPAAIHSHGSPSPFSYGDMAGFLSTNDLQIAVVGSSTDVVRLMVRTDQTPHFTKAAANKFRVTESEKIQQLRRTRPELFDPSSLELAALLERSIVAHAKLLNVGYYRSDESGVLRRLISKVTPEEVAG